jgi:hypothetical protein
MVPERLGRAVKIWMPLAATLVAVSVFLLVRFAHTARVEGAPPRDHSTSARPAATSLSPEQDRQRHLARHRKAIDDHGHETADGGWAAVTAPRIQAALKSAAARGGFEAITTDCRSRTCVSTVQWPSATAAQGNWRSILFPDYGSCGVEVMLDEPSDPNAPFQTQIVFDCSRR